MNSKEDRRRRRSSDPLVALHYQLSHSRTSGEIDVIVLADPSGVVVAGAGSWAACEELAAYAPLLASEPSEMTVSVSSRVASLKTEVRVRSMSIGGQDVLLCAKSGPKGAKPVEVGTFESSLDRAAEGISRILLGAA